MPIKTHLAAYSREKVLSAIKNELDRGGQVFYVLPRIKGNPLFSDFLYMSFNFLLPQNKLNQALNHAIPSVAVLLLL